MAFGASADQFLQISKVEANNLLKLLPVEAKAADLIITTDTPKNLLGKRVCDLPQTAKQIRQTFEALVRSFAVPHEVKEATIAVALYHWFPPVSEDAPDED